MIQLYLNKERFNTLIDKRYKKRNAKIIQEGCLWYLKKSDLLKCDTWDLLTLDFIQSMIDDTFYCFNFITNKDFTGWLYFNK